MSWILYIIVTGTTGTYVGYNGDPVAHAPDFQICESIGASLAQKLNTYAVLNSQPERYEFRCIERASA
jgi:hypothetical protein